MDLANIGLAVIGVFVTVLIPLIGVAWKQMRDFITEHAKNDIETFKEIRASIHKTRDDMSARMVILEDTAREERKQMFDAVVRLSDALGRFQVEVAKEYYSKDELKDVLKQIRDEQISQSGKADRMETRILAATRGVSP